jgi:hypothetical protein
MIFCFSFLRIRLEEWDLDKMIKTRCARHKMVRSRMFSNIEVDDHGGVEMKLEINHLLAK